MAAVPDSWVATGAIGGVGVVGVVGRGCVVLSSLPPPRTECAGQNGVFHRKNLLIWIGKCMQLIVSCLPLS